MSDPDFMVLSPSYMQFFFTFSRGFGSDGWSGDRFPEMQQEKFENRPAPFTVVQFNILTNRSILQKYSIFYFLTAIQEMTRIAGELQNFPGRLGISVSAS
jgi:hypothetical protein